MTQLREVAASDFESLQRLGERNGLPLNIGRRYWETTYLEGNPALGDMPEPCPPGWVLEEPGKDLVGFLGNIPRIYYFGERKIRAAAGGLWVVDPDYRSSSMQLTSRFFGQKQIEFFLDAWLSPEAARVLAALGARKMPAPGYDQPLFRPLSYSSIGSAYFRKRGWPLAGPAGALAGLATRLARPGEWAPASHQAPPGAQIETEHGFDESFDDFWRALRDEPGPPRLLQRRDRASLAWYFREAVGPGRGWVDVCRGEEGMLGYTVYMLKNAGQIGLNRIWMADLQVLRQPAERAAQVILALTAHGLKVARKRGFHVLEAVGFSKWKREVLSQVLTHRRTFPNWAFYYRVRDKELAKSLSQPEVWDPGLLDGDAI